MPVDLVVRGGWVVIPGSDPVRLDVALTFADPVARTGLNLGEVGDLDELVALDTLDATDLYLHVTTPSTLDPATWILNRGEHVALTIRRGVADTSAVVQRLPR